VNGEARKVSRRQMLRWTTQAAALVGGLSLVQPGHVATAAAPIGGPAVKPASKVRDVLPAAPPDAVALTVDDGPDLLWTPHMLDLLHRNGIRATFSLIGAQARAHPGLAKSIVAEGHSVTNHSMTHPLPFSRGTLASIRQQITDAQSAITDACGVTPTLFRAPGGDWSAVLLSAVADLKMVALGWDVDPRDWSRPGTGSVTSRLLAARPGDILLCHDGGGDRAETIESLRTVLPTLKARGLQFVTL
jgi:peptidoglycan-N-acetylglucosamine deacetylase